MKTLYFDRNELRAETTFVQIQLIDLFIDIIPSFRPHIFRRCFSFLLWVGCTRSRRPHFNLSISIFHSSGSVRRTQVLLVRERSAQSSRNRSTTDDKYKYPRGQSKTNPMKIRVAWLSEGKASLSTSPSILLFLSGMTRSVLRWNMKQERIASAHLVDNKLRL